MVYSLQAMRFIAACMIFLSHLSFLTTTQYSDVYNKWFSSGNFGVTFFFLLSGFVISYKHYDEIDSVTLKASIEFTVKKIKKIYPLYFITIIIYVPSCFMSYFANPTIEIPLLMLNIFMLKSYIPWDISYFSYNSVSWFLSTIIILYFISTFIIYHLQKRIENSTYKCLVYMGITYLFAVSLVELNFYDNQFTKWFFYISPFFRIFDFTLGILCGVFVKLNRKIINNAKRKKILFSILEVLSILAFIFIYSNSINVSKYYKLGIYYVPFLIVIVIIFAFDIGLISVLLKNKVNMYLSSISFEFFLIHSIIITNMVKYLGYKKPMIIIISSFIISILLSVIAKKKINTDKFWYRVNSIFSKFSVRLWLKAGLCTWICLIFISNIYKVIFK